jgi:hypothetical protein
VSVLPVTSYQSLANIERRAIKSFFFLFPVSSCPAPFSSLSRPSSFLPSFLPLPPPSFMEGGRGREKKKREEGEGEGRKRREEEEGKRERGRGMGRAARNSRLRKRWANGFHYYFTTTS